MTPATEQRQTRVCGLLTFKTLRPLSPDFLSPWPLPQEVVGPRPFSGSQPPSCSSTFALPKCTPCLPWHIQTQQEAWPRESVSQDQEPPLRAAGAARVLTVRLLSQWQQLPNWAPVPSPSISQPEGTSK